MTKELKPCPFCGDKDDFNPSVSQTFKFAEPGDPDKGTVANIAAGYVPSDYYVECDKCAGCGPPTPTEAEAIAAWNTRADRTALIEAGDALERYTVHDDGCELVRTRLRAPCTCGKHSALKNWREAKQ